MLEIRKNLDLRKILVSPKIFLKSRVHCISFQFSDVCQIRLDFVTVDIGVPSQVAASVGQCTGDSITVTSPSGYAITPLCGTLSGTHSRFKIFLLFNRGLVKVNLEMREYCHFL